MSRLLSIIILLLTVQPITVLAAPSPATPETKRVLILYSLDKGHPAHGLTEQGVSEALQANRQFNVQLFSEYLDMGRFPDPGQAGAMAAFLRHKYKGFKIDCIITIYPSAIDFLQNEGRDFFPDVPIVASEVSRSYAAKLENSSLRQRLTATIMGENIAGVLDAALRMRPATKRIALVAGVSPLDLYNNQIIRDGLKRYPVTFEQIDLTQLSMTETLTRVSKLPSDTIIFYTSIIKDAAGESFAPRAALIQVSKAASAPVFSLYDTYLGHGIVGGRLVSFEMQGKTAATLALRIMAGESPAAIPFGGDDAYVDHYDWRELTRWHIPLDAIPAGAGIIYRQLTLWEEYHWFVIGAISLATVEAGLIIVLVINLRRRKKAEQELSESRTQLNLAVESAAAGLWSLDMETGRFWTTDKTLVMYGFLPGEMVNRESFLAIVHADDRELVVHTMDNAVQTRMPFNLEYRITLPDGTVRWLAVRGCFSPKPEMAVGLAGAAVDITERKQLELDLQQKRNELTHVARVSMVGQLASTLAHELNQPLGAILRNAEAAELFLQDPAPDLDELRAIMADIRKDDQRAGEVIDRMRGLMKQRKAEHCPLDLNHLTGEVIALVQADARKRHVRLTLDFDTALPPVQCDLVQLQQVLINLLLNAFDSLEDNLPESPLVTVSVRPAGAKVEIAVSDNGSGIAPDNMQQIFSPFFTSKTSGLGMGLAISRGIVEAHGGQLRAENNESGGAIFTISLPVVQGNMS